MAFRIVESFDEAVLEADGAEQLEGINKPKKKKQEVGDDKGLCPDISASPSIFAKLATAHAAAYLLCVMGGKSPGGLDVRHDRRQDGVVHEKPPMRIAPFSSWSTATATAACSAALPATTMT